MGKPESTARGGRKQRYGTCHRCGWRGSVVRVTRRDRKRSLGDRTFTRLCEDCVDELLGRHGTPEGQSRLVRRRSIRHRDVA